MPIARLPLAQPIETRDGTLAKDSKCVNGYFETVGQKREFIKRPGLKDIGAVLANAQGQGLYNFNGSLFAAVNNILYKINPTTYAVTTIGTMTGTIGGIVQQCYFNSTLNNTYLFVQNQVNGYTYNPATGVFAKVVDDGITVTTVITGGTHYANPIVTFSAPSGGGTTAIGTVQSTSGIVTGVTVTNPGSGYTSSDTLVVTIGDSAGTAWSAGLTVAAGDVYWTGTDLYTVTISGITGTTAPTFTGPTPQADGSATAQWLTANSPAWVASTPVAVDYTYWTGTNLYTVTVAGTTGSTAPTFTSGTGSDGTATVKWVSAQGTVGSGAYVTALLNGFPAGPYATGAVYLDTYTVIGGTNGEIYTSEPNNPTIWHALNYITAEAEPDGLVGIVKHLNYVLAFGQWSTDFYYDTGSYPGSPLAIATPYHIELGCANGDSICSFEQTTVWIGIAKEQGPSVYSIMGVSPSKISTPFIDRILNNSTLTDVIAYPLRINGHTFYILTLADLNQTLVYDLNEKQWYQWTMWAIGDSDSGVNGIYAEQYFRPSYFAGVGETYFLLDDDNGKLYTLSDTYYNDAGAPIYYRAVTPIMDSGTTKRKFYHSVEIVGDKIPATMNIRHTSDDYKTWSNYRQVNLNNERPQVHQAGASRRRAWEFLCTDNQPIRLEAAEIDFDIGELENVGQPAQQG